MTKFHVKGLLVRWEVEADSMECFDGAVKFYRRVSQPADHFVDDDTIAFIKDETFYGYAEGTDFQVFPETLDEEVDCDCGSDDCDCHPKNVTLTSRYDELVDKSITE